MEKHHRFIYYIFLVFFSAITENAKRAGVNEITKFNHQAISDINPPCERPGLVIINPPYGTRIGEIKKLIPLYQTTGSVLKNRFSGWRAGIITSDDKLARATGLPFMPTDNSVLHGGLRINLFQTAQLP